MTGTRAPAASQRVGDPWLLLAALTLAGVGLLMVYSAGSALAAKRYLDGAYFFKSQLLHVTAGVAAMAVLAFIDYRRLERLVYPLLLGVFALLVLVLIPGVGHEAGGAMRWLRIGGLSLQPAEMAKLALVVYLAYSLSRHSDQVKSLSRGLLPNLGITALLIMPVILEPDLGMSVILFALACIMLFVAGARVTYLLGLLALAAPLIWFMVAHFPWRFRRIVAFLDPWSDPGGAGFQIIHSFYALGSGGLWGAGLGAGKQKLFYLPEAHTDFILSVLGEELGLWGVLLVIGLFLLLIVRGVKISLEARELFGTYLAMGATLIIGLQAFINAGVVMGLLPTKGLTMPFISYGGSSLLTNFSCVGLLLSVAAGSRRKC
ncbi:MAG: putative lipid II flippase FtsW [Desulfarculaceae bacterium]|nr:putative lipid II flippase FtsW [Desulfarculaceae bacterium]MCF8070906.1 putative lipid II flippase FtsW [Desulfarculaceae bacterium]MCF8100494.1 putative lipid II flippase FtsW [Desulfarculaceae bacterium]MCF8116520.1 putative lipid II flippase FtsW [Desulfarculaceae bacterium]